MRKIPLILIASQYRGQLNELYYLILENYYRDHSDAQLLQVFENIGLIGDNHRACSIMNEVSRRGLAEFSVRANKFEVTTHAG